MSLNCFSDLIFEIHKATNSTQHLYFSWVKQCRKR